MPEGHNATIEVSNIMSFVLYTQILKQSVLKPASPGITLKSTFSLSLCTYITRMDVMLDFICMGPVDLPGARRKRQNTK